MKILNLSSESQQIPTPIVLEMLKDSNQSEPSLQDLQKFNEIKESILNTYSYHADENSRKQNEIKRTEYFSSNYSKISTEYDEFIKALSSFSPHLYYYSPYGATLCYHASRTFVQTKYKSLEDKSLEVIYTLETGYNPGNSVNFDKDIKNFIFTFRKDNEERIKGMKQIIKDFENVLNKFEILVTKIKDEKLDLVKILFSELNNNTKKEDEYCSLLVYFEVFYRIFVRYGRFSAEDDNLQHMRVLMLRMIKLLPSEVVERFVSNIYSDEKKDDSNINLMMGIFLGCLLGMFLTNLILTSISMIRYEKQAQLKSLEKDIIQYEIDALKEKIAHFSNEMSKKEKELEQLNKIDNKSELTI